MMRIWSAPAERSGDGAFDLFGVPPLGGLKQFAVSKRDSDPKRRRRFALPPHSKLVTL